MINIRTFVLGLILSQNKEEELKQKGIETPSDFTTRNAMNFALSKSPVLPISMMNNDANQLESKQLVNKTQNDQVALKNEVIKASSSTASFETRVNSLEAQITAVPANIEETLANLAAELNTIKGSQTNNNTTDWEKMIVEKDKLIQANVARLRIMDKRVTDLEAQLADLQPKAKTRSTTRKSKDQPPK